MVGTATDTASSRNAGERLFGALHGRLRPVTGGTPEAGLDAFDMSATGSYPPVRMRTALAVLRPPLSLSLGPRHPGTADPGEGPEHSGWHFDHPRLPGRPAITRRHLGFAAAALVATALLVAFGQTLSRSNAASDRVAALRAENAALAAQLESGRRELAVVRSGGFGQLEARSYGLGRQGERVFSLAPGAPAPAPVVPLGAETAPGTPDPPLEQWLTILFGA
jgi:hypothetical protein